MKTRSIILVVAASLFLASCGPKVSDTTVITGNLGDDAPESIYFSIKPLSFNKAVTVENGQFKVEIPKYLQGMTQLRAGKVTGNFVSDGTPLTISFNDDYSLKVVSKYPKISVQTKFDAFQKAMQDLQAQYQPQIEAAKDEATEDQLYDAFQNDVKKLCLSAVDANKDNVTAVSAIDNLRYLLNNDQMDSVLMTIDTSLAKVSTIATLSKSVAARKKTAEGQMFTDFKVKNQKLSDYVGHGKYILVDFWASWCGPCKAEMPNIKNVYEKYAGPEFDILSVAVWDKKDDTIESAKEQGIVWNQIIDAQRIPTNTYGIDGIPHIILFGPDGTIVKRDLRGDDIEAEVAKHVKPVK
ncbi:MAG: TlpA family protein disulfide reductase [Bacteroidales bacterium]|jgi:thiol-disulfide isomerase/thioredoxin|nr:TlpA family protein disulfide reductase [Bacteroidales bacterium]